MIHSVPWLKFGKSHTPTLVGVLKWKLMMSHSALYHVDVEVCHTIVSKHKAQFRGPRSLDYLFPTELTEKSLDQGAIGKVCKGSEFLLNILWKAKRSFFSLLA